ncbi:MAG: pentapeptide repeat-containing protein [Elusimicrobiota bacterium]|nr:pentapeptide repeat-containing protein [Elusimicrobiota bacterium]
MTGKVKKECSGEVFSGLDFKGKAVTSRQFRDCTFRNCDFTGAAFRFCKFQDCNFESCNLSLVKLGGSLFSGTAFKDSKLVGINWTEASWPGIKLSCPLRFESCLLNDSTFLGLSLGGTRISRCQANGADFREADLSKADLTHTDFSGALFGKTDLTGANLDQARNYAIRISDNRVKDARFSMPEAMALLYCLDIKIV